jgi:hypothetical protein
MKQHFEVRAIEWGMAGWAVMWGLQCLLVPEVFTNEVSGQAATNMLYTVGWIGGNSPVILGLSVFLVGLFRGAALFVNGLWIRTPIIRLVTSAASAFLLMNIVIGLYQAPPNFGVVTYLSLFFADCFSAYRASRDYQLAEKDPVIRLARG